MGRGRKRKFNPLIPEHIDQSALPQGLYWEDNRWYVRDIDPKSQIACKKPLPGRMRSSVSYSLC